MDSEERFLDFGSAYLAAHCYLEVFKGIGVVVGGVDTVEKPVHRYSCNDVPVEEEVQSPRLACGQLVQDQWSYIVVVPPFKRVVRNPNRVIP